MKRAAEVPSYNRFRPRQEPAAALYDAFLAEAAKRGERMPEQWIEAESQAVHAAAVQAAAAHGLRAPTQEDVARANTLALGHIDYGAKWAYALVEIMRGNRPAP